MGRIRKVSDFVFADSRSEENAIHAFNPDRPSFFLVLGTPGCGKTNFVESAVLRLTYGLGVSEWLPSWNRWLPDSQLEKWCDNHPFLFFDNISLRAVESLGFSRLLATGPRGLHARRRRNAPTGLHIRAMENSFVLFATMNATREDIPHDVARRFRIIEIKGMKGVRK